jgi:hypothetical protein
MNIMGITLEVEYIPWNEDHKPRDKQRVLYDVEFDHQGRLWVYGKHDLNWLPEGRIIGWIDLDPINDIKALYQ